VTGISSSEPQLWQRDVAVWRRTGKVWMPQRWHSQRVARGNEPNSSGRPVRAEPAAGEMMSVIPLRTLTSRQLTEISHRCEVMHGLDGQTCRRTSRGAKFHSTPRDARGPGAQSPDCCEESAGARRARGNGIGLPLKSGTSGLLARRERITDRPRCRPGPPRAQSSKRIAGRTNLSDQFALN
jgi:hypothetical protein